MYQFGDRNRGEDCRFSTGSTAWFWRLDRARHQILTRIVGHVCYVSGNIEDGISFYGWDRGHVEDHCFVGQVKGDIASLVHGFDITWRTRAARRADRAGAWEASSR